MFDVRRIALLLVAGGLTAALAAGLAFAARSGTVASGFHGIVYRGPTTPVCRNDVPCQAPASGVTLRFSRSGTRTRSVRTNGEGTYRILLPAAIYTVSTDQPSFGKTPSPRRVKVRLGHVDRLDFLIDTGIR